MPRIRSVHPGLFTDEDFAPLSDGAQIFLVGIWTQADDQGVFEWKPGSLRLRIRPGKDGSAEEILNEIERSGMVKSFTVGDRKYGAIKNFRKWQRPKKPTAVYPLPDELKGFVRLSDTPPEPEGAPGVPKLEVVK